MSGVIGRFARLSCRERGLRLEAAAALAVASAAISVMPFRRVMALARPVTAPPRPAADEERAVRAIRLAIAACARRVPWRALCLEQALASQWMLGRRGIGSTIHYGVARGGAGLAAHAWVRTPRLEVIGCENAGDFAELARFPTPPG